MSIPVGNLGVIDTLTVGGRVYTDLDNLIQLAGSIGSSSYAGFRLGTSSSGYAVTAGKTLQISSMIFAAVSAGATMAIGYCDNDLGANGSTPPTNPVYIGGFVLTSQFNNPVAGTPMDYNFSLDVPAGKFVFMTSQNVTVRIFGYEV